MVRHAKPRQISSQNHHGHAGQNPRTIRRSSNDAWRIELDFHSHYRHYRSKQPFTFIAYKLAARWAEKKSLFMIERQLGLPIPRKILLPGERETAGNGILSPGNSPRTVKIAILAVESNKNYIFIFRQAYKIGILNKQPKALWFPEIFCKHYNFHNFLSCR